MEPFRVQNVLMGQMCAGRAPSGVRPAGVVAEGLFFPDGVFSEDVPFIAFDEGIAAIYGDATVDGQALCHHLLCVHVKFFHNGTAICLFHCSETHPALRHPSRNGGEGWCLGAIGSFFLMDYKSFYYCCYYPEDRPSLTGGAGGWVFISQPSCRSRCRCPSEPFSRADRLRYTICQLMR